MHVRGRVAARLLTDSHGCHTYGWVGTMGSSRCKRQGGGEGVWGAAWRRLCSGRDLWLTGAAATPSTQSE